MNKPIDMKELINKLERINETTSEQYEVMLDKAQELGGMIAGNAILDKRMNPDVVDPEYLATIVDKHVEVATTHVAKSAHKYFQQHLKGGPRGVTEASIQDRGVVHASSTRALARDIVQYAKKIVESNNIDISTGNGPKIWEGIMARQLSDAVQGLEDYVSEARIIAEYEARTQ